MPNMKFSLRGRLVLATATTFVALLTVASPASAVDRYASPAGSGVAPCTDASPAGACSLTAAVAAASGTDDVTLLGGTYPSLGTTLAIPDGVRVHGATGAEVVIPTTATNGISVGTGATLSDVRVNHTGTNLGVFLAGTNATIERTFVDSTGPYACAAPGPGNNNWGLIRDSVCWQHGGTGSAVTTFAQNIFQWLTLRNVTAVSTSGYGVESNAFGTGNETINATNVIAVGASDLRVGGSNGTAGIIIDHSNYDSVSDADLAGTAFTVTDAGSNVAVPVPAFVNAAGGDFHQTAASTGTIDRGVAGYAHTFNLGLFDLDGNARNQGASPDIGAYEFASAPPTGGGAPLTTPSAAPTKKCKKGRKLRHGKCVKKKKK